jgi:hypothetical protein
VNGGSLTKKGRKKKKEKRERNRRNGRKWEKERENLPSSFSTIISLELVGVSS